MSDLSKYHDDQYTNRTYTYRRRSGSPLQVCKLQSYNLQIVYGLDKCVKLC